MDKEKVLIIDDEVENLFMLKIRLEHENFEVLTTNDPFKGLETALAQIPDVILLDINMPGLDGFGVCRRLKADFKTSGIPVIMLTCMDDTDYKIEGLEGAGADDYLIKDEIDHREIAARIRSILRRTRDSISANPLTRLPGNRAIDSELQRHFADGRPFVIGYVDIDNFKAYNDIYGFQNGDKVILAIADILRNSVGQFAGSFIGHIGGDDFLFLAEPENATAIAAGIVSLVEQTAPGFYSKEHREVKGINSTDRDGNPRFFSFFAVSIALIPNEAVINQSELSELAGKMKKTLKARGGNRYGGPEILV
ncbi:response regulator [bacterium]|nr:response regulator [bacterium]